MEDPYILNLPNGSKLKFPSGLQVWVHYSDGQVMLAHESGNSQAVELDGRVVNVPNGCLTALTSGPHPHPPRIRYHVTPQGEVTAYQNSTAELESSGEGRLTFVL